MTGAPLPLLGTFHEVSFAVPDVRAAVEFYERLGFTQATTTDTFSHPYGVLSDGRLSVGLHQRRGPSTVLTFVRPGIARWVPQLTEAGIELTVCQTGDEVFNEIGFEDPFGHALAVLEARTYSPVARTLTEVSLCGDFAEVSLPVTDFAAAQGFWEPLGFVAAAPLEGPYPHLPLTSDYLDISFHHPRVCERAMLVFRDPEMPARIGRLKELGLPMSAIASGAADGTVGTLLESPDGTPLMLLESER
jgi:catechol 2,3-dioxygenase-like lactoylglutathione lyase family enzyme